jgi:hypothetical protein
VHVPVELAPVHIKSCGDEMSIPQKRDGRYSREESQLTPPTARSFNMGAAEMLAAERIVAIRVKNFIAAAGTCLG